MTDERPVETLSREAFEDEVRSSGVITLFHYTPNNRGFIFLQICAGILLVIALTTYTSTRFEPLYWAVVSGVLTFFSLFLVGLVVRWTLFARWSAVAFDDEHLYIVGRTSVERISWRSVSLETSGLSDASPDEDPGVLHMSIETRSVTLRLFNPYVWIDDFPSLLAELLSQIKRNQQDADPQPAT